MVKNKFIISGVLINSKYEVLVFAKRNNVISGKDFILPTTDLLDDIFPEESLAKEISTISGLVCDIHNLQPLVFVRHKYPDHYLTELIYLITNWDGEINLNNSVNWVGIDQLSNYLDQGFYQDFFLKIIPLIKGIRSN